MLTALLALTLVAGDKPAPPPERQWSPTAVTATAAVYAAALPVERQPYARFVSLHDVPREDLVLYTQTTQGVFNSLSKASVIVPVVVVPGSDGRLLYLDLTLTRIDRAALDNLGLLGSGAAPFPDPFFHQLVREEAYEDVGYFFNAAGAKCERGTPGSVWKATGKRPVKDAKLLTIHGPWLNPGIVALAETTQSASPIFEARWFWDHALDEPRYHEILGLGETINAFKDVFYVDSKTADKLGAQTRGVVLDSEVALQSRILERTPTLVRFGRGTFQQSLDFNTSLNAQDPLKDLLESKPDANESIATLFNGLNAYYVNDARGNRLDLANPNLAQDSRTRLRDHQVRTGFHCMGCHEPERGWILQIDEVGKLARPDVELISKRYANGDKERGQKILEKYFSIDVNELLAADQLGFESAVKAATTCPDYPDAGGLSCPKYSAALQRGIWEYVDRRVDLAELAAETGHTEAVVKAAIEGAPGLDHTLVGMVDQPQLGIKGRPQRRDQVEAGVGPLFILLETTP